MTALRLAAALLGRLQRTPVRTRRMILAGSDAVSWVLAVIAGTLLRYDFAAPKVPHWPGVVGTAGLAAALQLVIGSASSLYRGKWRVSSFDEAGAIAASWMAVMASLLAVNLVDGHVVPESVPVIAGAIAVLLMSSSRYMGRAMLERSRRPSGEGVTRLIVFGAGEVGHQIVTSLLRNPNSPYVPVALLDDAAAKRHLSIMGVPVVGTRHDIARARDRYQADALLIAIRAGGGALNREVSALARAAGLSVKVVPSLQEVIEGSARLLDIRQLRLEDILGRHPVQTDLPTAAGYLTGRRVLVTGAGGSIGSELCRQIHRFAPAQLIMLDRDESALHALQLSIEGRALLDDPNLVLCDIRDRAGVDLVFEQRRPEVVFHVAALKHLSMLEANPGEALQTNVWGTLNVLEAAVRQGVERFVNVSTDKAVEPSSVLGYTKRIAERLTATAGMACPDSTYLSVRFGNVLGSRGSVLHTFMAQINAKSAVTVTHPEVRRYFMTVEEAVQLVVHAGAVGSPAEALVLDMGEPMKIAEVAQRLIEESGHDLHIVYTGLRPGEKLDEILFNDGEPDVRPCHPLISHVDVPPLHPGRVLLLDPSAPAGELVASLRRLSYDLGFRVGDKPAAVDFTTLELDPGVSHRLMDRRWRSTRHAPAPAAPSGGAGTHAAGEHERCSSHRRWSDADAHRSCAECSDRVELRGARPAR